MAIRRNEARFPITAQNKTDKAFKAVKGNLNGLAKAAVSVTAVMGAVKLFGGIIKEADLAERQLLKLNAIVRTTGGTAGFTGQQLDDMARSVARNTLASVKGVQDAIGILATFRTVSGDTFREAIGLSQDLATVMGTDIKQSALQLGKALEDPTKGLTAMARSGVSFSQSEQVLIKSLQASGKLLEAQGLILDKLSIQVGGVGKAEAGGLAGAVDGLSQTWDDFLIGIGNLGPLSGATTAINALSGAIQNVTDIIAPSVDLQIDKLIEERARLGKELENSAWIRTDFLEWQLDGVNNEINALIGLKLKSLRLTREAEQGAAGQQAAIAKEAETAAANATRAAKKKSIDTIIDGLQKQAAEWGKTKEQIALYRLELLGANADQITIAETAIADVRVKEQQKKALVDLTAAEEEAMLSAWDYEQANRAAAAAQRELHQSILDSVDPLSTYRQEMLELELALEIWPELADEIIKKMEALEDDLSDGADSMEDSWKDLGLTFTSAFEDAIVEGKNLSDVLKGLEQDILRIVTRKLVTEPLGNMFTSMAGSFFGAADGGLVSAGSFREVNERGPEMLSVGNRDYLMMGDRGGNITPNHKLGGGNITIQQTIMVQPGTNAEAYRQSSKQGAREGVMAAQAAGGLM